MKKDSVKYIVLIVFSLATLVLLILNAVFDFNVFWTVNISDITINEKRSKELLNDINICFLFFS